ncbi:MAG: hypothetical protein ABIQ57_11810 [Candidatus Kapaibacterium sp.]
MSIKLSISFLTILSLIVSLVFPTASVARTCAGYAAVVRLLERNEGHHHEHCGDQSRSSGAPCHGHEATDDHEAGDHHDAAEGHESADHHDESSVEQCDEAHCAAHPHESSYCCFDGHSGAHTAVDNAIIPSGPTLVQTLAVLYFVAPAFLWNCDRDDESLFKIGASPPFLASIAHATYLRISVLLI